ncbi:MAG: Crp/Fnr family transcriptional regulator [Candidatus Sulfotelmatobacter sp.]
MYLIVDSATNNGPLSSVLARTFRGKLCDVILRNRNVTTFEKDQVIYDAGEHSQTFFFLQKGFVKVGSITEDGHELIYDVRKAGDIVGELCASGQRRQDRAVALERTELIVVPLDEILEIVQTNRHLLQELVQMFCESLSDAYDQLNTLASSDTVHRLVRVLLRLGAQLGHTLGQRTELSAYLTQEEISQMVVARRERVSTAMNFLRNRGMVDYSHRGYLILDLKALQNYAD